MPGLTGLFSLTKFYFFAEAKKFETDYYCRFFLCIFMKYILQFRKSQAFYASEPPVGLVKLQSEGRDLRLVW
jgi:hypothetical protein